MKANRHPNECETFERKQPSSKRRWTVIKRMWTVQTKVNRPNEGESSVIQTKANRHPNEGKPSSKRRRTVTETKANRHPNEGKPSSKRRWAVIQSKVIKHTGKTSISGNPHRDEVSTVIPMKAQPSTQWNLGRRPDEVPDAIPMTAEMPSHKLQRLSVQFIGNPWNSRKLPPNQFSMAPPNRKAWSMPVPACLSFAS